MANSLGRRQLDVAGSDACPRGGDTMRRASQLPSPRPPPQLWPFGGDSGARCKQEEVREEYQAPRRQTRPPLGTRLEQLPFSSGGAQAAVTVGYVAAEALSLVVGAGGGARAGPGHDSLFWLARRRR